MAPPIFAITTAGSTSGSTQHEVQATADIADVAAAPVSFASSEDLGAHPQPGVVSVAGVHLDRVRTRLSELAALEKSLAAMVRACDVKCPDGAGPDCVIFDAIGTASHA